MYKNVTPFFNGLHDARPIFFRFISTQLKCKRKSKKSSGSARANEREQNRELRWPRLYNIQIAWGLFGDTSVPLKRKTQTTFPNHVRNFIAFFLHQKSKSLLLLLFHLSQRICKCCAYGYYVSSGLVSVIYDFHAVIGTVPDTDSALDKILFCFFLLLTEKTKQNNKHKYTQILLSLLLLFLFQIVWRRVYETFFFPLSYNNKQKKK
jgi:hypothetical protein